MRLSALIIIVAAAVGVAGCAPLRPPDQTGDTNRVKAVYNLQNGSLEQLLYDRDGDGRVDAWMFLDRTRVVRVETDSDGNGVADRWEYYGADQRLERVGLSTTGGGKPDRWVTAGPAFCGSAHALVRAAEAAGIRAAVIPVLPAAGADR